MKKTMLRIFFVSEKNAKFVVGEVEYHVGTAIVKTGISGSLWLTRNGRVGQTIDFGELKLKSEKEEGSEFSRLVIAE